MGRNSASAAPHLGPRWHGQKPKNHGEPWVSWVLMEEVPRLFSWVDLAAGCSTFWNLRVWSCEMFLFLICCFAAILLYIAARVAGAEPCLRHTRLGMLQNGLQSFPDSNRFLAKCFKLGCCSDMGCLESRGGGVVVGTLLYMFTVLDSGPTPLPAQVGLTFVQDHSGRVFKRKGTAAVTLKDVQANREVSSWWKNW